MRKLLPLILLLLIASGVLGWLRAGTSAGARTAELDSWSTLQSGAMGTAEYKALAKQLKQSALLPLSRKEQKAREEAATKLAASTSPAGQAAARPVPPFPKILGGSRLNRTHYVHVLAADNSLTKLRGGDVLESGWEIKTVDRRQVIAVFDGEELTLPVIPYLKGAFEKPAKSGDNKAGGGGE